MSYQVDCPSNTYLCYNEINNVYDNLKTQMNTFDPNKCPDKFSTYIDDQKNHHNITSCPKEENQTNCNNCDYLFENLITGFTSCKDMYEILKTLPANELNNQVKYNIYQLAQMRIKQKPMQVFGTFSWWKEYVWGINKIQNYIYIISFTIALIMITYYSLNLFNNLSTQWIIYTLIVAFVLLVVIMYFSFTEVEYDAPIGDPRLSEKNKEKYGKHIEEKWRGGSNKLNMVMWIIPVIIIGLLIVAFFIKNKTLINVAIYATLGLIIALNAYYTFLIPQLIITGIILQKILLSNMTNSNVIDIGIKMLILLFIIIISSVEMAASLEDRTDMGVCTDKKSSFNLNFPYWLIVILIFIVIADMLPNNILKNFKDYDKGWGLFLEPFFHIFLYYI